MFSRKIGIAFNRSVLNRSLIAPCQRKNNYSTEAATDERKLFQPYEKNLERLIKNQYLSN
jgi:hypothetical protein